MTGRPENLDDDKVEAVSKTVHGISGVLGNSARRPKLKEKLPDQLVNDMKTAKGQGWGKLTPVIAPPVK